ncbi:hypothetical protein RDI58_020553 [Solanum bulbocastanum]|uniref:Uncharacterized protein n=1 Tax=Solanum bulbocastanum TaxID=147425 RepID=A0AAN8Y813_SOLBU
MKYKTVIVMDPTRHPQLIDKGSKSHSENSSSIALAFTHSFIPLYFSSPIHSLSMDSLPMQYSSRHIGSYRTLKK